MGVLGAIKGLAIPGQGQDLEDLQDQVRSLEDQISTNRRPFLSAEVLTNVSLSTASTLIKHKLSQSWVGWIITRRDADARVWSPTSTSDSKLFLDLKASAPVVVNLLVW